MTGCGVEIRFALRDGARALDEGRIDAARLTAEVLLAHVLGRPKEWLYAHGSDLMAFDDSSRFQSLIDERLAGTPTQYLTGVQEFYGRSFRVTPDVLIPRPETEHVVEAALERLESHPHAAVVDVGTGSGAIAVTMALERPDFAVTAVDLSAPALAVARGNASSLGAATRVQIVQGDLLDCFGRTSFDAVLSNPPYVPEHERYGLSREVLEHEPHLALFGGPDGMVNYRRLIADSASILRPGGWLILELAYNGGERVRRLLEDSPCAWQEVAFVADLAGYPRVIAARLPSA